MDHFSGGRPDIDLALRKALARIEASVSLGAVSSDVVCAALHDLLTALKLQGASRSVEDAVQVALAKLEVRGDCDDTVPWELYVPALSADYTQMSAGFHEASEDTQESQQTTDPNSPDPILRR